MTRQLNLFGDPEQPRNRGVGPAPVADEVRDLARDLPSGVRLGTSSWSFPGWQGLVYDRAASKGRLAHEGLIAYAQHPLFRAVGIDRTFYAPLAAEDFARYASVVPDDFRFLVKAPALCTTPRLRGGTAAKGEANELFLDASFAESEVVAPFVDGLGEKAGPLVFQFPPIGEERRREPERFAEELGSFLGALPRGPLYAVELRDAELLSERYAHALASAGARHCYAVHPRMPGLAEQRSRVGGSATGPLVVRWMLRAGLGYEQAVRRYEPFSRLVDEDPDGRAAIVELIVEHHTAQRPVVVIANNKAEGSAPLSVARLAGALAERLR